MNSKVFTPHFQIPIFTALSWVGSVPQSVNVFHACFLTAQVTKHKLQGRLHTAVATD